MCWDNLQVFFKTASVVLCFGFCWSLHNSYTARTEW